MRLPPLLIAVLLSCVAFCSSAQAKNLARTDGVVLAVVNESGQPVSVENIRDLHDGKVRSGGTSGVAPMRVRIDFGVAVAPQSMTIHRSFRDDEKHKRTLIEAIEVLAGDDLDSVKSVGRIELTEEQRDYRSKETAPLTLKLPACRGRLLQLNLLGKGRLSIREIEVHGSDADHQAIHNSEPAWMTSQTGAEVAASFDTLAKVPGVSVLHFGMNEKQVRAAIARAEPQSVFLVQPKARWILRGTLQVPDNVTILGFHSGVGSTFTFQKGFHGTLAEIGSGVTLKGILFDGNKQFFTGDGIADPADRDEKKGVREQIFQRVEVRNCRGNGFALSNAHYFSKYLFCSFDHNDGYGVSYGRIVHHHTDNYWESCHIGSNGQGGVAFHGLECSSVWDNCEFFSNRGPAFEQFPLHRRIAKGKTGDTDKAAYDLVIRDTVIRGDGPVWLNRGGQAFAIVFEDCRLKHNAEKAADDLTQPVGMLHVESGSLQAEIRGGFCWDNNNHLFTTGPKSAPGSRLVISGASRANGIRGNIHAPGALLTVQDVTVLDPAATIQVKSGIGLDPTTGEVVRFGAAKKR